MTIHHRRLSGMRVASAQPAPVYLDREATLEKVAKSSADFID